MFRLVTRKMLNNKWMVACLLIGSILAVAMIGSIPMYADSVLEQMIRADLRVYQEQTGEDEAYPIYAGKYQVSKQFSAKDEDAAARFDEIDDKLKNDYIHRFGIDTIGSTRRLIVGNVGVIPDERAFASGKKAMELQAMLGLEENIELIGGKMPSDKIKNGVMEAIIVRGAEKAMELAIGDELTVSGALNGVKKIRIVGVFDYKDNRNGFWYFNLSAMNRALVIDHELMYDHFVKGSNMKLTRAEWMYALDYTQMNLGNINHIIGVYQTQQNEMNKYGDMKFDIPATNVLLNYMAREAELNVLLLVLQIPILLMLAYYIYMVSKLIIEFDKNEISVLKSRGAKRGQIFSMYLIQSGMISLAAMIVGPILGHLACLVIGAADGFLSFSSTYMPITVRVKTILFCALAALFSVLTMLVPAINASRTDIVAHKRKKARSGNKPLWQKLWLDVILLAVSGYGIYVYATRQNSVVAGAGATPIEPLLYLISSTFTLGAALLILRLYPYCINALFNVGKKKWGPVMYSTLTTVARQRGKEQFLVIFLIFTITFGIFSASAARTIDKTMENQVDYYNGAQYSVRGMWYDLTGGITVGEPANDSTQDYRPLDMAKYSTITGLSNATKVFKRDEVKIWVGSIAGETASMMAVQPDKFYKTLEMPLQTQTDITTEELCRRLASKDNGALISRAFANAFGLNEGDKFSYTYGTLKKQNVEVVGIFDYWPQYDPLADDGRLIVINYDTLAALPNFRLMPYEVWYTRDANVSSAIIAESFAEKGLSLVWSNDSLADKELIRSDAKYKGTNGALTLGFIVIMLVSIIGFVIYWILAIRSRTLQFGVLRAMGLTVRKVMLMLFGEQIFLSGFAIDMGVVLGTFVSMLFVPLLQLAYSNPTPPQAVMLMGDDYLRVFACIAVMLTVGLSVIGRLISKLDVTGAIKLGED